MKKSIIAVATVLAGGLFAAEPCSSVCVSQARPFGKLSDGRETKIWRINGSGGMSVDVTDYGGRIVRVYVPDRFGNLADVALGWNSAAEYEKYGFSMGTLVGRFANRIKDGKFKLDGREYVLPVNENKGARHNSLHSGPEGWDSKIWNVRTLCRNGSPALELSYTSPDGEMGFPGTVVCKVRYIVKPGNVLVVEYEAVTDKPTVINLTHHGYWNLAGEASGDVLDQELMISADFYTRTDDGLIPVGNVPVKGTGFDFSSMRKIGAMAGWMAGNAALKAMDNWYDHNFFLKGDASAFKFAASMRDGVSGRKMEIWTTEPCLQMYGAQNMSDMELPAKKAGEKYRKFQGVALETQHAPDSPNQPGFPSTVLRPGETFKSRTEYRFFAE